MTAQGKKNTSTMICMIRDRENLHFKVGEIVIGLDGEVAGIIKEILEILVVDENYIRVTLIVEGDLDENF